MPANGRDLQELSLNCGVVEQVENNFNLALG
jgi:hypothetical protein